MVKTLKDLAKFKTEKSKNFVYNLDQNYVYPYDKLWKIYDSYYGKKLFPDGYKPEEQGAVTNDKGNVVYDENGKIKREPTILEKGYEKIKPLIFPGAPADLKSQTPLSPTPEVNPASVASRNMSPTGLTAGENAYLSNEEKEIKLRSKGMA